MANSLDLDLSIIILSFNVKDLILNCLESVYKDDSINFQVIVVDNASVDGSVEAVRKRFPKVEIIENKENLGFSAGNNIGVMQAKAPVVLFLNPDTEVKDNAIGKTYNQLISNPDAGAITCRVQLPDGKLDYSCHRGFPSPWNAFCYFTGLSKAFPKYSLFAGYTASYLDTRSIHEIDCISGSFLMVRKIAGDQINWWDEDYFWNGEDIEFCYKLRQKGWKIFFYPTCKVIHYKGSSSGLWSTAKINVKLPTKLNAARNAASAMRIFYMKHYFSKYPPVLREFILWSISLLEQYRKMKIRMGFGYK